MNRKIIGLLLSIIVLSACEQNSTLLVERWELGTSTLLLNGFSQDKLNQTETEGVSYIELDSYVFRDKTDEELEDWIKEIEQKVNEAGLKVWSVHLPFSDQLDISTLNEEDRKTTVEKHKKIMAMMAPLDVQKYVVHPSAEPVEDEKRSEQLENAIESLEILTREAKKYSGTLALEAMPVPVWEIPRMRF